MPTRKLDDIAKESSVFLAKYGREYFFCLATQECNPTINKKGYYCLCSNVNDEPRDEENGLIKFLVKRRLNGQRCALPGQPGICPPSGKVAIFSKREQLTTHYLNDHPKIFHQFLWKISRDSDNPEMSKSAAKILLMWKRIEDEYTSACVSKNPFLRMHERDLMALEKKANDEPNNSTTGNNTIQRKPGNNEGMKSQSLADTDDDNDPTDSELGFDAYDEHDRGSHFETVLGAHRDINNAQGHVCSHCGCSPIFRISENLAQVKLEQSDDFHDASSDVSMRTVSSSLSSKKS